MHKIHVYYSIFFQSQLDTSGGCALHCSILAESIQESHFMIGRDDVSSNQFL